MREVIERRFSHDVDDKKFGEYPDIINQTVQDSYMANRVKASQDSNPLAVAGVGTALWYGFSYQPVCRTGRLWL